MSSTVQELVSFMERIEEAENFDTNEPEQPSDKPSAVSGQKRKASSQKFCMLHGYDKHTTNECKAMHQQAKRNEPLGF